MRYILFCPSDHDVRLRLIPGYQLRMLLLLCCLVNLKGVVSPAVDVNREWNKKFIVTEDWGHEYELDILVVIFRLQASDGCV